MVFAAGLLSTTAFTLNVVLGLFLFAVALAVAAIPEALPAIVTVGLSLGVRRMAAANAIVRKLPAVETLGAATVICSDKTGTLTRNEMTVRAIATSNATVEVGGSGYIPEGDFTVEGKKVDAASPHGEALSQTLRAAALANDSTLGQREGRWAVQGDPTEGALVVAARKFGIGMADLERLPRIAEIPFTSERKRHTTVHADLDNPAELRVSMNTAGACLCTADGPKRSAPSELGNSNLSSLRRIGQCRFGLAKCSRRTRVQGCVGPVRAKKGCDVVVQSMAVASSARRKYLTNRTESLRRRSFSLVPIPLIGAAISDRLEKPRWQAPEVGQP